MFASIHAVEDAAALLACARAFSPLVERTAPDTVTLDVAGLERIYGLPQELAAAMARRAAEAGLHASIAIASNPDAAICAARAFPGIHVIPFGEEGKYLGGLPVAALSAEMTATLERWGIRRFRDLAALPENGIAARLGAEGVRLRKLARGEFLRPLVPLEDPPGFEEDLEPEYPVDLLEPLAFLLARMLNMLCTRLASHGLALTELRLRLALENGGAHERVLRLPVPMLDARAFLKLLQLDLSAHPPAAPVARLHLAAGPARPRAAQNGLFVPAAPEPQKLEITLARLAALVGEENVGSAGLPDTHRPGAFHMRRFHVSTATAAPMPPQVALRIFRPPRAAEVEVRAGRPARVSAGAIRGNVTTCGGPWRTSGDWWRADAWGRDEWDVALHDGALYRLYREHATGRWFLEGTYD
ncbi:MAG: hypothetical protein ACE15B_17700 [Bryobacteraceae bacterium]